jgi:hypothetical protein
MNDICAMLLDYGQSRRGYLTQCLSIDKKYDDALNNDIEAFNKEAEAIYQNMKQELNAEQRRKTLIERFKNRRDAKKAGE